MTFWQENYGFVREVYDFRCQKYQEWMDNLEAIVGKVMAQNVQYTYKEFKNIQDSLTALTRDLEKEGMKEWLDLMLEKVALRVSDEGSGGSLRDKEFKAQEKKKLTALIERHDKLLPSTKETQAKVEIYARCYAYGDDINPVLKTLEEMRHLSIKEIHPHNMNMIEEQIEKAEKVISTVDSQHEPFEELIKRGQKLLKSPNVAPFLAKLIEKLELTWKEANEKSKERLTMLTTTARDWEHYDEMRNGIIDPLEKLENELKKYRKFYDPAQGAKRLAQRKATWEELKNKADQMYAEIKKCYETIVVVAGTDKKEFLDKEVGEVDDKRLIIKKCEEKLAELEKYNNDLTAAVTLARELNEWSKPSEEKLKEITTSETMSPEDRVREILAIQEEGRARQPQMGPLAEKYKALITEEDTEKSETAKNTTAEWTDISAYVQDVLNKIEMEAGSISQDQRYYADYLCGVKDFKPWMDEAEKKSKEALAKPATLVDAAALLDSCKAFDANCAESKTKLDEAGKCRDQMEKPSNTVNEVPELAGRWDVVKKSAVDAVERVQVLVTTWNELQKTTEDLAEKMNEVPKQTEPNLEELEKVFTTMKELFAKKKELLGKV